jgi:hypothetical protein
MRKFWELESCDDKKKTSAWNISSPNIGDNPTVAMWSHYRPKQKQIALKRFEHLERKLTINKLLKVQYVAFINEYIDLGHMEPSPPIQLQSNKRQPSYFLTSPCCAKTRKYINKIASGFRRISAK